MNASQRVLRLVEWVGLAELGKSFPVGNGFEWRPKSPKDKEFCDQAGVCGSGVASAMFGLFGPNDKVHGIAAIDSSGTLIELAGRQNMPFSPKYYRQLVQWVANDPRIRKIAPKGYKGGGKQALVAALHGLDHSDPNFSKMDAKFTNPEPMEDEY